MLEHATHACTHMCSIRLTRACMHILLDGTQAAAAADEAKALQQAAGGEDLAKCAAPPTCASNMHPTHVHGT